MELRPRRRPPPESLAELDAEIERLRSEIQAAEATRECVQALIDDPIRRGETKFA